MLSRCGVDPDCPPHCRALDEFALKVRAEVVRSRFAVVVALGQPGKLPRAPPISPVSIATPAMTSSGWTDDVIEGSGPGQPDSSIKQVSMVVAGCAARPPQHSRGLVRNVRHNPNVRCKASQTTLRPGGDSRDHDRVWPRAHGDKPGTSRQAGVSACSCGTPSRNPPARSTAGGGCQSSLEPEGCRGSPSGTLFGG